MILTQIMPTNLQIDSLTGWSVVVVIALYLSYSLIDKYLTKRKTTNTFNQILDRLEEQSLINTETMKYLKTISLKYSDELNEEQFRIFINKFLSTTSCHIKKEVRQIIRENHIKGNETKIQLKVKNFIKSLYTSDGIELKSFKFNETLLSDYMNTEWVNILTDGITDCIYSNKDESERIKTTDYFITQEFQSYLSHYLNKIK